MRGYRGSYLAQTCLVYRPVISRVAVSWMNQTIKVNVHKQPDNNHEMQSIRAFDKIPDV
jgi:hypothetical protein